MRLRLAFRPAFMLAAMVCAVAVFVDVQLALQLWASR